MAGLPKLGTNRLGHLSNFFLNHKVSVEYPSSEEKGEREVHIMGIYRAMVLVCVRIYVCIYICDI